MSDYLVWMDLEMSGLNVERERILEMATIITDANLEIVAELPEIVIHQSDELLAAMDDWNQHHHGNSGLIERVRASSTSETEAERQVREFIASHVPERAVPLAGNSVHQDRLFLAKYMPSLEKYLHYRNVDVSTLKELLRRWNPEVYAQRPPKRGSHRALDDIRESIDELRYYRSAAFRT